MCCRLLCWQFSQRSHRTSKMKPVPLMMASLPTLWGPSPVTPSAVRGLSLLMTVQPASDNPTCTVIGPAVYSCRCIVTHTVAHSAKSLWVQLRAAQQYLCNMFERELAGSLVASVAYLYHLRCSSTLQTPYNTACVLCCAVLCCVVHETFQNNYCYVII